MILSPGVSPSPTTIAFTFDSELLIRRLRREHEREEADLRLWMDRRRQHTSLRGALQGDVVSIRNGRFVFAVRAEHRAKVRGIIHGESASGATLFIEPEEIVLRGNKLADLAGQVHARPEVLETNHQLRAVLRALDDRAPVGPENRRGPRTRGTICRSCSYENEGCRDRAEHKRRKNSAAAVCASWDAYADNAAFIAPYGL